MTFTDEQYQWLSDRVYWLDPKHLKHNTSFREGSIKFICGKKFKILKLKENSKTDGMQAMAVAPLDEKGNVDTSRVVISYAGTNTSDIKDIETDLRTIAGLFDKSDSPAVSLVTRQARFSGQLTSATEFAKEVKNEYKDAEISTTGHSLGEYLALYVAAENQWKNVGFNGPDPYELLSPEAKKWIKENPGMLTNYRNRGDLIGNLMGDGTGAEIKVSMEMGLINPLDYHDLDDWRFDEQGNLIIPENDYNIKASTQQEKHKAMSDFSSHLGTLKKWREKFTASGGHLSANERIYLNHSQTKVVVETMGRKTKSAMEEVIRINQSSIERIEMNWAEEVRRAEHAAPSLTAWEVKETLASVGVTWETHVMTPKEKCQQRIQKARRKGERYDELAKEIKNKIDDLLARDQELANQLKG
ncbi:MAG: lipase [Enterococcus faecium]|uniref:Lipase n=1 Tax=Enterococcus mundtii TaxID=53346 RepID=A0A2T5DBH6_ENTMU|nr:lipase [Enterococcus mundtii]MBE6173819.1 lipase [Enterococcus faecium]PTO35013.1 lipase [Enterococcus mundtii]